jgi:hypothetical protein
MGKQVGWRLVGQAMVTVRPSPAIREIASLFNPAR